MFLERLRNTMKIVSLHSHSPGHVEVLHCTVIWTVVQYRHKTVKCWNAKSIMKIFWNFEKHLKWVMSGCSLQNCHKSRVLCSGLLLLCLSTEQTFVSNKLKFVNIHLISHVVDDFHSLPILLKYIACCKAVYISSCSCVINFLNINLYIGVLWWQVDIGLWQV